jgi:sugar phosphate isomerase/epimerase
MAFKVGITNYSFNRSLRSGSMNVEGFLDFCGKAGFDGVDLISYFWKDKENEMKDLPKWLKRNRLELVGYGTRSNFLSADPAEVKLSFENIRVGLVDAKRIGCKTIRVFGGGKLEGWTSGAALAKIVECFKELVVDAEKAGVVITVENHGGFPATSDEVIACIEEIGSPWFASLLDIGNFLGANEDPVEAAAKLAKHVKHVHVKDMMKFPAGSGQGHPAARANYNIAACTIGKGQIPLREVFEALRAGGYSGYLSMEAEGPETDDEGERVLSGLAHIRKVLKEMGE